MSKYEHNGYRYEVIDNMIEGIDRYQYFVDYPEAYTNNCNELSKSLSMWKILFDLNGGIKNYLKDNDLILKDELCDSAEVTFTYILDTIGSISYNREFHKNSKKLKEDQSELFKLFLDNCVFDNVFLSFCGEEYCLRTFSDVMNTHFYSVWEWNSKNCKLDKTTANYLIKLTKDRIKRLYNMV